MERIIILDSAQGKVFVREVPDNMIESDGDEILEYFAKLLKLDSSNCTYQICNDDDYVDDTTSGVKKIKVTHLGEDYSTIKVGRFEFEASLGLGEALLSALS